MFPENELAEFCRSFFRLTRMEEPSDLLGEDAILVGENRGTGSSQEPSCRP